MEPFRDLNPSSDTSACRILQYPLPPLLQVCQKHWEISTQVPTYISICQEKYCSSYSKPCSIYHSDHKSTLYVSSDLNKNINDGTHSDAISSPTAAVFTRIFYFFRIFHFCYSLSFHCCHYINIYPNWLGEQHCNLYSNVLYILSLK
jgi:hypothetical protein